MDNASKAVGRAALVAPPIGQWPNGCELSSAATVCCRRKGSAPLCGCWAFANGRSTELYRCRRHVVLPCSCHREPEDRTSRDRQHIQREVSTAWKRDLGVSHALIDTHLLAFVVAAGLLLFCYCFAAAWARLHLAYPPCPPPFGSLDGRQHLIRHIAGHSTDWQPCFVRVDGAFRGKQTV